VRPSRKELVRALWPTALVALVALLLPLMAQSALFLSDGIAALVLASYAYSVQLTWRYLGVMNVATGGIAGLGGYSAGLLWLREGWPFWLSLCGAVVVCMFAGGLLGIAAIRVRGHYFLLVSYAVAALLGIAEQNLSFTGGDSGLFLSPQAKLFVSLDSGTRGMYWALLLLCFLTALVVALLRFTRLGHLLMATRDNESMTRALGLATVRARLVIFSLSAIPAAVGGALFAVDQVVVTPGTYGASIGLIAIAALLIGGGMNPIGPVLGATLVSFLPDYAALSPVASQILYASVLIIVIIVFREGLAGIAKEGQRVFGTVETKFRTLRRNNDAGR
jgi:branched-chain amino acid transport system permease protein